MKRLRSHVVKAILAFILSIFLPHAAHAQQQAGSLTALYSAACAPTTCVILPVSVDSNTITIEITGTQVGTQTFEFLGAGGDTWRALTVTNLVSAASVTSSTSTGTFVTGNANFQFVRVRRSASTSGAAVVTIRGTPNGAISYVILGGGGGTIGTVNQGTASATEQWLVNCVTGCASATSDPDDNSIAFSQTNSNSNSLNYVSNGSNWVRIILGQTTMSASLPVTIASNQSSIPVAATLGAETTKVIGTINISAAQTIATVTTVSTVTTLSTITNVVHVDDNGGSLTVDGSVTAVSGTASNLKAEVVGVRTNNGAAVTTTNLAALTHIVCTSAVTYTAGRDAMPCTDVNGSGWVSIRDTDGSAIVFPAAATDNSAFKTVGAQIKCDSSVATPTAASGDGVAFSLWCDDRGRVHTVLLDNGVGAIGAAPPANAVYLGGLTSGATGGLTGPIPVCDQQQFLDMTSATTTEIVALTSGRKIHVCFEKIVSNGTTTFTWKKGTGTNCGTGTAAISNAVEMVAQFGWSSGTGLGEIMDNQTAANALCATNSAGVNLHIFIRYGIW